MTERKATNGWFERMVLDKLDTLEERANSHSAELKVLAKEVAKLQVKSGIWGFFGGAIPVGLALAYIAIRALL